jgi:hypothetical protein
MGHEDPSRRTLVLVYAGAASADCAAVILWHDAGREPCAGAIEGTCVTADWWLAGSLWLGSGLSHASVVLGEGTGREGERLGRLEDRFHDLEARWDGLGACPGGWAPAAGRSSDSRACREVSVWLEPV